MVVAEGTVEVTGERCVETMDGTVEVTGERCNGTAEITEERCDSDGRPG